MNEPIVPPPPPPPVAPETAKKKGLSPVAWVLIGCLGIMVVGGIMVVAGGLFAVKKGKELIEQNVDLEKFQENPGLAAAEMVVRLNPELELVETDEDAGTITIREKSTGKTATFDWSEIEQGRITFTDEEGKEVVVGATADGEQGGMTITTGDGESEIHIGEGSAEETPDWVPSYPGMEPEVNYQMSDNGKRSGSYTFQADETVADVTAFYADALEAAGFSVQKTTFSGPEGETSILGGTGQDGRGASVSIGRHDGRTAVTVTYQEQ